MSRQRQNPEKAARFDGAAPLDPRCRVLVVDDDARWRTNCAEMLTRAGFAVNEAGDGELGWAALLSGAYRLVITDHLMPKASGLALVRRMRVAGMNQPVILVIDTPQVEIHTGDPWQRIDGILVKPFTLFQLLNRVEAVLRPDSRDPFTLPSLEELHHTV